MTSESAARHSGDRKTVAVMQPYFFPYAGYFRLFELVDEFVIFDCVQFPRRGRVHRTLVPGPSGTTEWLTLPLARQPRDTCIADLAFASGARGTFDERLARLSWIESSTGPAADDVRRYLYTPLASVLEFLVSGLRLVADLLEIDVTFRHSRDLQLAPGLRSQDRVVAAAAAVGATHYVNAAGGRHLYDPERFARAGITLSFLPPYTGPFVQLLPTLMTTDPTVVRADVQATCA